jgi:hypothetical protein
MPRDASGTYTLPIAPFVPLTLAKSADMNTALTDIADALTDSQSRASPTPAQGDLNMNGHNIVNLGQVVGDVIASRGVYANTQTADGAAPFGFHFDGGNAYIFAWGAPGYFDWFNNTTGTRAWHVAAGDVMALDPSGNLNVTGTVTAGNISSPGALSAASISTSAGIATGGGINSGGAVNAGGNGVSYSAFAGGGANHAFALQWNGSRLAVYVDGAFVGYVTLGP